MNHWTNMNRLIIFVNRFMLCTHRFNEKCSNFKPVVNSQHAACFGFLIIFRNLTIETGLFNCKQKENVSPFLIYFWHARFSDQKICFFIKNIFFGSTFGSLGSQSNYHDGQEINEICKYVICMSSDHIQDMNYLAILWQM